MLDPHWDAAAGKFIPVNEANLTEARFVCGVHVLFDNRFDVARGEGVEIERAFDRNAVGHEAV